MTMTTTLTDADGGTDVLVVHEGIPDRVPVVDNETGTRMALANLAATTSAKMPWTRFLGSIDLLCGVDHGRAGEPQSVSSRTRRLSSLPPGLRGNGSDRTTMYCGTLKSAIRSRR